MLQILQDQSFLSCVELKGKVEDLLQGLERIISYQDQQIIKSEKVINGQKWATITIFNIDR